jgi:hypothetical protein
MSNRNKKGLWYPDIFLEYIKGYGPLGEAMRDGMEGLNKIIEGMQWSLFPSRSVPVPGYPGRTTQGHDYFQIEHPNPTIREALQRYFIEMRHRGGDSLFGNYGDLSDLFSRSMSDLFLYGKAFYAIEWGEVDINGLKITLPTSFNHLHSVTTRRAWIGGFVQTYSWLAYLTEYHFRRELWGQPKPSRKFKFADDEIVYFKYPFGSKTPVRKTYKQVRKLRDFWKLGLDQGRANNEPDIHTLSLEKARHTLLNQAKREHDILKAKVRKEFGNTLEAGLNITQFYDVYTVGRYKKYLNALRRFYVKEFNEQVLRPIALKNKWGVIPILTFGHFQTDDEIERALQDFREQKLDVNGFILAVVKKP